MSSKQQELEMSKSFVRIVSGNYRKN